MFWNKKRDAEIAALRRELDALWRWADDASKQLGRQPPITPQGGGGPPKPPN